MFPFARKATQ